MPLSHPRVQSENPAATANSSSTPTVDENPGVDPPTPASPRCRNLLLSCYAEKKKSGIKEEN
jgi:hypothetical protein